jgi:P-type E1-E2 ATPase
MTGVFGLMDPLRPGIKDAVLQCQKSGITVRMCTGDSIDTAIAISLEAGIIT